MTGEKKQTADGGDGTLGDQIQADLAAGRIGINNARRIFGFEIALKNVYVVSTEPAVRRIAGKALQDAGVEGFA